MLVYKSLEIIPQTYIYTILPPDIISYSKYGTYSLSYNTLVQKQSFEQYVYVYEYYLRQSVSKSYVLSP
jgi:hypothetical protein